MTTNKNTDPTSTATIITLPMGGKRIRVVAGGASYSINATLAEARKYFASKGISEITVE